MHISEHIQHSAWRYRETGRGVFRHGLDVLVAIILPHFGRQSPFGVLATVSAPVDMAR